MAPSDVFYRHHNQELVRFINEKLSAEILREANYNKDSARRDTVSRLQAFKKLVFASYGLEVAERYHLLREVALHCEVWRRDERNPAIAPLRKFHRRLVNVPDGIPVVCEDLAGTFMWHDNRLWFFNVETDQYSDEFDSYWTFDELTARTVWVNAWNVEEWATIPDTQWRNWRYCLLQGDRPEVRMDFEPKLSKEIRKLRKANLKDQLS